MIQTSRCSWLCWPMAKFDLLLCQPTFGHFQLASTQGDLAVVAIATSWDTGKHTRSLYILKALLTTPRYWGHLLFINFCSNPFNDQPLWTKRTREWWIAINSDTYTVTWLVVVAKWHSSHFKSCKPLFKRKPDYFFRLTSAPCSLSHIFFYSKTCSKAQPVTFSFLPRFL